MLFIFKYGKTLKVKLSSLTTFSETYLKCISTVQRGRFPLISKIQETSWHTPRTFKKAKVLRINQTKQTTRPAEHFRYFHRRGRDASPPRAQVAAKARGKMKHVRKVFHLVDLPIFNFRTEFVRVSEHAVHILGTRDIPIAQVRSELTCIGKRVWKIRNFGNILR